MARVEIEQQISFFSFVFARVSEVRHMDTLVDYEWMGKTLIYTMHNAIDYSWIGKR